MKLFRNILGIVFLLNASFAFSQTTPFQHSDSITLINDVEYYVHTVKEGETAYSLSKNYGITLETLYENNPNALYGLRLGELLLIPTTHDNPPIIIKNEPPVDKNLYIYHQVKKGETYYGIAQKYHVSVADIRAANPELTDVLAEGASLRIPYDQKILSDIKTQQTAPQAGENTYIVHTGENLQSIAKTLNTTTEALIKANPDILKGLTSGDAIQIPPPTPQKPADSNNYHIVQYGETVYSISRKYGIRIDSLLAYNKQIINNHIAIGDSLVIKTYTNIYDFIEYRTDKKEPLINIANRFQIPLKELQARNPRLGNTVSKNDIVFVPIQKNVTPTSTVTSQEQKQPTQIEETTIYKSELFVDLLKAKDTVCIGGWDTQKQFTVALMLPFSTKKLQSGSFSNMKRLDKASDYTFFRYVPFYQGVLMALDSLADKGMNITLNVYDVSDDFQMEQVLGDSDLKRTDLIISIVYTNSFKKLSDFSRQNNIPLINAVSRRNNILTGYPNIAKIPPNEDDISQAAQKIVSENENANILLIRKNAAYAISNVEKLKALYPNCKELVTEEKSVRSAMDYLDSWRENYVFMFSETKTEILDLMRILDEKRKQYNVTLVGFPNWSEIAEMDYRYAQDLNLHFIEPYVIDYRRDDVQNFVQLFRARFNSEPNALAFQGYDIANYFLYALGMFDKNCLECSGHLQHHFLSTNRIILKDTPGNGYNNTYWDIYTIQDYQIVPINY